MKLNKLQRYTAYIIMLELIESKDCMFLCHTLLRLGLEENQATIESMLPELWDKKPHDSDFVWWLFYERDKRIAALKACIEETHT